MKHSRNYFLFLILISFSNSALGQSLINGNFENGGNTIGFLINGAGYSQIDPPTGSSSPGNYSITTNPQLLNSNFNSGVDHSGTGKMLVVDGNTTPGGRLWSCTSTAGALKGFTVGTKYTFSYWIKSVSNYVTNNATQADINVYFVNAINITPASMNNYAPLPSQDWTRVSYTFTANADNILIELRNNNTSALGNDFALDDFDISPVALPLTLTQTSINPSCPSSLDGSIKGVGSGGVLPYKFSLATTTSTTSNPNGIFTGLAAGLYTLSITDSAGSTTTPSSINITLAPPNDITINAPPPPICAGSPINLSVSGSTSYLWTASPSDASLTAANNTSASPVVSPLTTTTYTVTSTSNSLSANMVLNGDFSQGNIGFSSDYIYCNIGTVPTNGLQGAYGVLTNPKNWFNAFYNCLDHSTPNGNMLVGDGSTSGTARVWYSQTPITLIPGKNYLFSYFLTSVVNSIPAKLEVLINNVSLGPPVTAPSISCIWDEHSYVWNSGTNTTAIISIINREMLGGGNDFAIDDLYFRETTSCVYQKSVTITVNPNVAPTIGTITHPTCLTPGSVVLNGLPAGNWTINPGGITGNTSSVTILNLNAGSYDFTVQNSHNCVSTPVRVVINLVPNGINPTFNSISPICVGTTISLPLSSTNGVRGAWSPSFNPNATTTYTFIPDAGQCATTATTQVVINPSPSVTATPSQTICSGDTTSIVLSPSHTGTVLTWTVVQNGVRDALDDSGTSITQVLETTGNAVGNAIYTITPELNGCVGNPIIVTATVNPSPSPSLIGGNICVDALGVALTTYTLNSGLNNSDYTFQWTLGVGTNLPSGNTLLVLQAGTYSLIATNKANGCISSTVFATVTSSLPATSISAVGSFAFDQNASITVTALDPNPNYQYALDYGPLQFSNIFTNVNPGNHLVTLSDTNGCTNLSTSVFIIGYPTYFTPNNDGFNDYWNVIGMENQPTAKIFIFDRYGKLLKQISSKGLGWDGTYIGALLPTSDYWFTIEYLEPFTSDLKVFKSHFSLKR